FGAAVAITEDVVASRVLSRPIALGIDAAGPLQCEVNGCRLLSIRRIDRRRGVRARVASDARAGQVVIRNGDPVSARGTGPRRCRAAVVIRVVPYENPVISRARQGE